MNTFIHTYISARIAVNLRNNDLLPKSDCKYNNVLNFMSQCPPFNGRTENM